MQLLFGWAGRKRWVFFPVFVLISVSIPEGQCKIPLHTELSNSEQIIFDDDVMPGPMATSENPALVALRTDNSSSFRLPQALVPISYHLQTRPVLDKEEGLSQNTAPGQIWIQIQCHKLTDKIVLHAQNLVVNKELTQVGNLNSETVNPIRSQHYDPENNFFIITLNKSLVAGEMYEVFLDFVAPIYLDRKDGYYRTTYPDPANKNQSKYLVSTLFAPTAARRAFPCFDEPQFRATFQISIGRTANYATLCNMDIDGTEPIPNMNGWFYDHYKTSVPMSTYLIAMTVFNFAKAAGSQNTGNGKVSIQTWADVDHVQKGRASYSVEATEKLLPSFEQYLNSSYVLPKLDSVAMPKISYGGMESWGLIIYQEQNLLYLAGKTSEEQRKRTTALISHELAHQWFGNLVTFSWWSDIWLSEGLTTYFQYVGVDMTYPEFDPWNNFVTDVFQSALYADSQTISHPLHNKIESSHSIFSVYDKIAYDKGSSIIRMTEQFLTQPVFQTGIRNYLKKYAFQAVHQDQLFESLNEAAQNADVLPANVTVKDILDTWTLQSGYPLVRVMQHNESGSISLTQEQYDPDNLGRNGSWWIPVMLMAAGNDNFSIDDTSPSLWMAPSERNLTLNLTAETDDWVVVNALSTGFYRVLYDDVITEAIQGQLYIDYEVFPPSARNRLIDDYFSLSYKGIVAIETALNMISYMGRETHFSVLKSIFYHIKYFSEMFGEDDSHLSKWMNMKLDSIFSIIDSELTPNEQEQTKGVIKMRRHFLLTWACYFKNPRCLKYARDLIQEWRETSSSNPIPTAAKATVYCAIAAGNSTVDQDFLLSQYRTEDDPVEASLLIEGLGCNRNTNMVMSELENMGQALLANTSSSMELTDQELKLKTLLKGAIKSSTEGRELSWKFIRTVFDDAAKSGKLSRVASFGEIVTMLGSYWNTQSRRDDLEDFISAIGNHRDSMAPALRSTISKSLQTSLERVEENIEWMQKFYDRAQSWFALENFYFPEGFLN